MRPSCYRETPQYNLSRSDPPWRRRRLEKTWSFSFASVWKTLTVKTLSPKRYTDEMSSKKPHPYQQWHVLWFKKKNPQKTAAHLLNKQMWEFSCAKTSGHDSRVHFPITQHVQYVEAPARNSLPTTCKNIPSARSFNIFSTTCFRGDVESPWRPVPGYKSVYNPAGFRSVHRTIDTVLVVRSVALAVLNAFVRKFH